MNNTVILSVSLGELVTVELLVLVSRLSELLWFPFL